MANTSNNKPKGVHLRGSTYHARLVVPKDLRDALGFREFTQSLETGDIRIAKVRGDMIIRGWKNQISEARGNTSPISEALLWKQDFDRSILEHNDSSPTNYPAIHDVLGDKLEALARTKGHDASKAFGDTLPLCGAKTRAGGTCRHKGNIHNGRCKLHGGASTGPINPACGPNNARYTNGLRTKEAMAIRKLAAALRKSLAKVTSYV